MTVHQHIVTENEKSVRLDKLVTDTNPDYSRSQVTTWIRGGQVLVNGRVVKANFKPKQGDNIEWTIPSVREISIEKEAIPLDIVYEDNDIIVVNKPSGMVVHPAPGHPSGTLVNALLHHCSELATINGVERAGIVHRIDKDTSGLLVVAKHDKAYQFLSEQLKNKDVERKYVAMVHGVIDHEKGLIDAPIGRNPKDRQKMGIVDNGKQALTHFKVLQRYTDFTYVECKLETGRTHQIRVHMRYIGHPVVGDPKYGPRKTIDVDGQALHAKTLGFIHPETRKWQHFEVPIPPKFQEVIQEIEKRD